MLLTSAKHVVFVNSIQDVALEFQTEGFIQFIQFRGLLREYLMVTTHRIRNRIGNRK